MIKLRRKTVAIATTALVLTGTGTALAYWTTTGSGSGSAVNASSNGTLTLHALFADGLTPGATEAVSFTADNPGSSNLYSQSVYNPVVTADAGHAGCTADNFAVDISSHGVVVPAHTSGVEVATGHIQFFDNPNASQDACKGATITISVQSN